MSFAPSPLKLWQSLDKSERGSAARAFWNRPPAEIAPAAAQEIVKVLRVRPQAFQKVSLETRVRILAGLAAPAESVAESLLVALHLEERRSLLIDFLDALGIPHEEGMIAEETEVSPPNAAVVRAAAEKLRLRHAPAAIRVYWNALWLQDRERWAALETVASELL